MSKERDYRHGADPVLMNDEDYAKLQQHKNDWQAAKDTGNEVGMKAAHDAAELLRASYGYSGGADGSEYNKLPAGQTGKSYKSSYTSPEYVNRYQDLIDTAASQILGREAFSYNPEKDPTYQQYKESYTRAGQKAMEDTLAQVSARTGGLASSYATGAAQQTYDGYMAALADKIPELKQLAYSMYQDEGNTQRANLEMLVALEQGDYAKYADLLAQYNTDRSFDYGVFSDQRNYDYQVGRDQIADQRYNTEWNYQVGRDKVADERYKDETAYDRSQDEWQKSSYASELEYDQALAKAQTLAAAGDFSGYKALGYSEAEISSLKTAYDRAQAANELRGDGESTPDKENGTGRDEISRGIYDQLDIMETRSASDEEMYAFIESLDLSDDSKNLLLEAYGIGG